MKNMVRGAAACAALLGSTGYALAVDIGGLSVPTGPTFAVAQVYENIVTGVGSTLSGYGKVDSINSTPVNLLCNDCELTYTFGGYVVTSISATDMTFKGGFVRFFLGFGSNNDFSTTNPGGSAGDLVEVSNGTPFLSLKGHAIDALGNTFVGNGVNINTPFAAGSGFGLADVDTTVPGIANAFFDTNTVPADFGGPADFLLTSSFSNLFVPYPAECPAGPACLSGDASFRGSVVGVVPEPETYALMLAGLGAMFYVARRRSI